MKKGLVTVLSAGILFGSAYQASASYEPGTKAQKLMVVEQNQSESPQLLVTQGSEKAPAFISGKISKKTYVTKKAIVTFLKENKHLFTFNPEKNLTFVKATKDQLGMTHYEFNQSISGVAVDNARLIVHTDKTGKITAINGDVLTNLPTTANTKKTLTEASAIQKAWKHLSLKPSKVAKPLAFKGATPKSLGEKAHVVMVKDGATYKVAYKVELQFIDPSPANWQIYVDAKNGNIISSHNAINEDGPTTGSGKGVLGDTKSLNTYLYQGSYYLLDATKPMGGDNDIETYTANNTQTLPGNYVTDTNNIFDSTTQAAAVDAHAYAGKVYDYYKNTFGRNSYDNKGASLISTVHVGTKWNNAVWNGQQMVYGDGDGKEFTYLSGALDVVAHELTHAVTEYTANLTYKNQSGALNESMSDIFGYFLDPSDWWIGEDVYTPGKAGDGLRNIQNPTLAGQPDNMSKYLNTTADDGGVHTNSGIPNKAAYLTITAVGKAKAEQIYYRALSTYMTASTNFSGARAALLSATADLYGNGGTEYNAVKSAWTSVGVN
ncbi:peptidase M4 thermolysin [Fictibacillus macauensis ZFHKF-1]|uniref:Neutral metalloproteinase n=1 Tax=Fictibacillus macauensis ZFHKF-1 TaxID=1196324 RepID=I8J1Q4_9BACL|nr:M4 family metallopeptidase [Fictibacillus macauensis]EIT85666.1 peptidase M4 thermolysin [Fictibacillus macauensis ZFHKF-1]